MPIAYRTDGPGSISVSVWVDKVTQKQAAQHLATLANEPEWGANGRILTDLCYVSRASIPKAKQLSQIVSVFDEQLRNRTRSAKWAVMANQAFDEATQFGDQIREKVRSLIVFFDLASACVWLDTDTDAMRDAIEELRQEARRSA
jgi:hypothetical protein